MKRQNSKTLIVAIIVMLAVLTGVGVGLADTSTHVSGIRIDNSVPGQLTVRWNAPDAAPRDYRIRWAKSGQNFLTWTDLSGNAFPTERPTRLKGWNREPITR